MDSERNIAFIWVPGHYQIQKNELADAYASERCKDDQPNITSFAKEKQNIKDKLVEE